MDDSEAGRYWEQNAEAWTRLCRQGYDVYRDLFNTPAFLEMLPDVEGLAGVDLGCGEGYNTRLLAQRGARMFAIDVAPAFVHYAGEEEQGRPAGIRYAAASAQRLPFRAATFDFAPAFMSLMDMPEPHAAFDEVWRVLRPGGFLQFSITHPCFDPPYRRLLRDGQGVAYAVEVGKYFEDTNGRIRPVAVLGSAARRQNGSAAISCASVPSAPFGLAECRAGGGVSDRMGGRAERKSRDGGPVSGGREYARGGVFPACARPQMTQMTPAFAMAV
jgi:SAM-dependent methyltransferase